MPVRTFGIFAKDENANLILSARRDACIDQPEGMVLKQFGWGAGHAFPA